MGNAMITAQGMELHHAAREGNLTQVKQLIQDGYPVNSVAGPRRTTPLAYAVLNDNTACMIHLLENGAKPTSCLIGDLKFTLLQTACHHASLDTVEYLVDVCGMKVTNWWPRPVDLACANGNLELVQYLVGKTKKYFQGFSLHQASINAHLDVMEYCLAQGADPHSRAYAHVLYQDSFFTPLHFVMTTKRFHDQVEGVELLLRHGADPFAITRQGCTVLHMANSSTAASFLVERSYWVSREDNTTPCDSRLARKLLCTRNKLGQDALQSAQKRLGEMADDVTPEEQSEMQKLVGYLQGWKNSRLFVPGGDDCGGLSVVLNPNLGEFQSSLSEPLYGHLLRTPVGEVASVVMGYLTPVDLLNEWHQWDS